VTEQVALIVRRLIHASPERIFDAWTQPEHLLVWWGPRPVTCSGAEVDLRVGGRYRIANAVPDGTTVIIEGEFREIERPRKLVYTWRMGQGATESSLVTVHFEARGDATQVIVVHDQIPSAAVRESHQAGWNGCLEGLRTYFDASQSPSP
jgi:uncharacterized protein YndB with AHSA1/START domain